jgi:hypothetical protein
MTKVVKFSEFSEIFNICDIFLFKSMNSVSAWNINKDVNDVIEGGI